MTQSHTIAVLGAGIMGLLAARALIEGGSRVRVFDGRGFPADNASFMAGGMLAPYAEIEHMDGRWIAAGLCGVSFWDAFSGGRDIGFNQAGSLLVSHAEDAYVLERFRAHLKDCEGVDLRVDVAAIEPELTPRFKSGIYIDGEAQVHPEKVMLALIEELREGSVELIAEDAAPKDFSGGLVVDCRGMGAGDPELRAVKGEIVIVRNKELNLIRPVRLMHPRYPLYIVPRGGGIYMIGATQIEAEGKGVSLRSAMELMSALYSLHPSFGEAEVIAIKDGLRPSYPDNLPRIVREGNVISANGLFRHGYLLSPVMADIIAGVAKGEKREFHDLFIKGDQNESDHKRERSALRGAA